MKVKQITACLIMIALYVIVFLTPVPASAWWTGGTGSGVSPDSDSTAVIQSGVCGDNLTYELRESGNLIISGTGPMYDYASGNSPWRSYTYNNPMYVYFDSGVTYIGKYAFHYCYRLKSVSFPDTLVEIGDHAFDSAAELGSIVLPEGLTTIGDMAFALCGNPGLDGYSFESVTLPSTIKTIGEQAFTMCAQLKSINLPDGLEYIGDYAFASCHFLTTIVMPDSVTDVGSGIFSSCSRLENLRLSDNLQTLPRYIYSAASTSTARLEEITLPLNLKNIESNALSGPNLHTIYIPGNVETIAANAFSNFHGTIYFSGDAPEFDPKTFTNDVTIYYPEGNNTWIGTVGRNYGSNVTWIAQEDSTGSADGKSGDVNCDGVVDREDHDVLTHYLADWEGYEIDLSAADVDGNGIVNARDRAVLARHLADWDGYEELPYTA